MTHRERTDAEIAGRNGYIYLKGHGGHHRVRSYKDWCRQNFKPWLVVANDGQMHIRLELDVSPAGHRMTEDVHRELADALRPLIDDKHLRNDTTVMMSSTIYVWARRIPRYKFYEVIALIKAILEPEGALVIEPLEGARLVAQARGHAGYWGFIESLPPGDYRAELGVMAS